MNIPYKKISVFLLSLLVTSGAWAEINRGNGGNGLWSRFNGGTAQQQDKLARKEEAQRERQMSKQAARNNLLERCKDGQHNGERACGVVDANSKRSGLTPEEKRALRRQIKDAGHQLYPAKP